MASDGDPIDALAAGIESAVDDDLDRAENACLEALSRIRKRKQEET